MAVCQARTKWPIQACVSACLLIVGVCWSSIAGSPYVRRVPQANLEGKCTADARLCVWSDVSRILADSIRHLCVRGRNESDASRTAAAHEWHAEWCVGEFSDILLSTRDDNHGTMSQRLSRIVRSVHSIGSSRVLVSYQGSVWSRDYVVGVPYLGCVCCLWSTEASTCLLQLACRPKSLHFASRVAWLAAKAKNNGARLFQVNSSRWARTTNLSICQEDRNPRLTVERATNCASEDAAKPSRQRGLVAHSSQK